VTTTSLLMYIILGSLGVSYLMYGKAQRKAVALFSGLGLSVAPYFTMDFLLIVPLAIVLVVLPFWVRV